MSIKRIAILDDYQNVALQMADWSVLQGRTEITVFNDYVEDLDVLVERLRDFEIVSIMRERTPFPRTVLERLPKLELLASNSSKNAAIDMRAASKLGIVVTHTDYLMYGTPELTWALILSAIRHIPEEAAAVRAGRWQHTVAQDINGRTLGIVGLGNFGRAVAKVGLAFGMNVIAWSRNLDPEEAARLGVTAVHKDDLFSRSDIVSIHMVLSDQSRGIVGRGELSLMKPDAWLVNTSRGPLVDEEALIETLVERRIAGAALDTYSHEPLPLDHPFRHLPNALAVPHVGFVTEDTYRLFYGQTVENIVGWLDGRPVRASLPERPRHP